MSNNVSIIIPVYNQAHYTKQCLEELFANTGSDCFELIVVDNHSTDETPELLLSFGSAVTVIANTVNMGFASACNQGARAASGQYILFLNNDTEARFGWLEPLVETLDRGPDIGAVGSQLLYPDGSLQHAGVVIISQKDVCSLLPRHVFMGENPTKVPVDRPMCFQALTAACLMLRKDDFDALGGFDEAYWNGCEDVDLCFRLRQAGKKIVYQPKSVVIHHESKSGNERTVAQPRNNARLRARWEHVIQPDIVQDGLIARRGPSNAVLPLNKWGPDPVEYLEIAAAWWTKREIDAVIAKEARQTAKLTDKLNQSRKEYVQLTDELNQSRKEYVQLTDKLEKRRTYVRELEIRAAEMSASNQSKTALLRVLNNDFNDLLKSRRWQIGNAMVRLIERLMFRGKELLVTDHIKDIFDRVAKEQHHASPVFAEGLNVNLSEPIFEPAVPTPSICMNTDIVICVHNALNDLKLCLDSVVKNTSDPYHLILVNDGSAVETSEYLQLFVHRNPQVTLLENEKALGYTCAANQGLRVSTAEHVVLLNSDTIVPRLWMEALTECALSDPAIGIVGPLSNAASWQSVPSRFGPDGDWVVNELPEGYSVDEMAELVYQLSSKRFPRVAFVNGFCFLIKRTLMESIGFLDEAAFPAGYGEENDYCLRAAKAGFMLAIADQGYVYHAKSRSYSHDRRIELSRQGGKALEKKHGSHIITRGTKVLRKQMALADLRRRIQDYLEGTGTVATVQTNRLVIRFVLPASGIGGGILSVVQETCGMIRLNHDASILTSAKYRDNYTRFFPDQIRDGNVFTFYGDDQDFQSKSAQADVLIATTWDSPRLIAPVVKQHPRILPAYYVQDYEPWFFPEESEKQQVATESYTLIPDMLRMAKTAWLCQTLERLQGVSAVKVSPGLDRKVFYPPENDSVLQKLTIGIVAMIRPNSPRRGAERTLGVLKIIQNRFAPVVQIHVFGCKDEEIQPLEHDFPYCNHGVLKREEVAALYRESALFVDFSDYQAFGRTGLEAMACGCVPILPSEGGVHEYAEHQKNALIVDTKRENQLVEALSSLVVSDSLRQNMRQAALKTVAGFSVERAVLSELGVIRQALQKRRNQSFCSAETKIDFWGDSDKLKIALLLALRNDGKPCGSSHIRLLNPLTHPSVTDRVVTRMVTQVDLFTLQPDILVVQRASVPDPITAELIITHCRSGSIRLVLEIDDDLLNIHHKTGNDVSYAGGSLEALEMIARNADTVVVSSMPLAESMCKFNHRVVCVPNVHDERFWLESENNIFIMPEKGVNNGRIKILYMGTKTHEHDLNLIKPAYAKILNEYGKKVELEIVGGIPDHVAGFARQLKPEGIGANSDAYCEFVHWFRQTNHWDFGIIPLELTPFNRKKSYIKFLDYAALGVPAICTDIEPYREVVRDGENGLLVQNDTLSWYQAMKRLIDDPELRGRLANNAFRDLTEKYILQHRAEDFLKAIAGNRLHVFGKIKEASIMKKDDTTASSNRRKKIEQYVDIENAHILEIGALDSPTYRKSEVYVKYLDYASKMVLAEKSDGNPRYQADKLVDIDYVCSTPEYSKYIQEKFVLVIANHVIEHIPDTIRWLNEIHDILIPAGKLFLSVPDKRYTFDFDRRNTTFIDLLRNYNNNVKKPDFYQILEHFYYHKSVSAQEVWNNQHIDKVKQYRFDPETAVAAAEKHVKDDYADVHCHVFTSDSFKELMQVLIRLQRVSFQVVDVTETEKMQNEFYVVLARSS